jgi:hypothetical protein
MSCTAVENKCLRIGMFLRELGNDKIARMLLSRMKVKRVGER